MLDLTPAGVTDLSLARADPVAALQKLPRKNSPRNTCGDPTAPADGAAGNLGGGRHLSAQQSRAHGGIRFQRQRLRPGLCGRAAGDLLQVAAGKVVATGELVGIRRDASWNVPEPELALVINSRGTIVGQTIGNDMSSRDIEGENLLYLPQAKIYHRSCALGPWITLGTPEAQAREWKIRIEIRRGGQMCLPAKPRSARSKGGFEELAGYLFRSQVFPHGAVLLTGTGIVPPEQFTLNEPMWSALRCPALARCTIP